MRDPIERQDAIEAIHREARIAGGTVAVQYADMFQRVLSDLPSALERTEMSSADDTISRKAAIDVLSLGKEILSRVLDDIDVVGTDREKYSWGLRLIESNIEDIKELPSARPGVDCQRCIFCGFPGFKQFQKPKTEEQTAESVQNVPKDDLISRKAAIDALCKACANGDDFTECRDRELKTSWCDNMVALRDLPSAHPEIVMCKDCKYHEGYSSCVYSEGIWYEYDYCSYAERRTDDQQRNIL